MASLIRDVFAQEVAAARARVRELRYRFVGSLGWAEPGEMAALGWELDSQCERLARLEAMLRDIEGAR